MILDTLNQSTRYRALDPRLGQAFDWLETFRPDLPDGRYDIDGDAVFALVQSYETKPAPERKFEAHRRYADVQYIAEGSELMYYAPVKTLAPDSPYNEAKDVTLYPEPEQSTALRMAPGSFAVFFPPDGHKPGCVDAGPERIRKVVLKVLQTALAAVSLFGLGAKIRAAEPEQVLFAFDNTALPFQEGVQLKLIPYAIAPNLNWAPENLVIKNGPPGSPDSFAISYYGSVCEVNGELWMWYRGEGDEDRGQHRHYRALFAKSKDGYHWEKPNLGLVEYGGNRNNNLIDLDRGEFSILSCVVYYEPESADPAKKFKMVYTGKDDHLQFGVAYSPDGVRWTDSPHNPRGSIKFEPGGGIKWKGAYYVNGQGGMHWSPDTWNRNVVTHMSYDFENWTESTVLGFQREELPPHALTRQGGIDGHQVHLGAGLWNRGNVIIGFYGQWNGNPNNDIRFVEINTGMLISHDAVHFTEPIPDFRIITAANNVPIFGPDGDPVFWGPALIQGQGFANVGDETLFWYSVAVWSTVKGGVQVAHWQRDRLGYLQPFVGPQRRGDPWAPKYRNPYVISEPLSTGGKPATISVNVSGVGQTNQLKVTVLDEQFNELPGYGSGDSAPLDKAGLKQPVTWGANQTVTSDRPIRIRVDFMGPSPQDIRFYAAYLTPQSGP